MADLNMPAGTQAATCFSVADTDSDGNVCADEFDALESCLTAAIEVTPSNAQPGDAAVSLFSGVDCLGDSLDVANNADEDLCVGCFDVCGREFSEASATAESLLNVRSIKVKLGMVRITYTGCYGRDAMSDKSMDAIADFSGPMDICFNIKDNRKPKHFELFEDYTALKGAKQYMAFHDTNRDNLLSRIEAKDMETAFDAIDTSGDAFVSIAELTAFIYTFLKKPTDLSGLGYGRKALEDMARAKLMEDESKPEPFALQIEAEASRLYGKEYTRARLITSHTTSNTGDPEIAAGQTDGGNVHMCADGRLSKLSLCYKPCNWEHPHDVLDRCWARCPDGTTDIGLFCARSVFKWDSKSNYYRGIGTPKKSCKLGGSFGPGHFKGDAKTHFTVGVVSDPQLPWCSVGEKGDRECAIRENQEMVKSLNNVANHLIWNNGDVVRPLNGVFLNGDLTAFAHEWQFDMFRKLYEENSDALADNNLKLPIWMNLGNHDIANNVGDCNFFFQELEWLTGYGHDGCAQRMLAYVRSAVTGCGDNTVVPAFGGRVDHYDQESAAYAVSFGKVRAVMLHNYPSYDASGDLDQFKAPMEFLKKEVEYANTTEAYLVLFWHDAGDHYRLEWTNDKYNELVDLLGKSRVIATFHGHIHNSGGDLWGGLSGWSPHRYVKNQWGKNIPSLRSFATDVRKFLLFDYNEAKCEFRWGAVDAKGGGSKWHLKNETKYQNTVKLEGCIGDDSKHCEVGDCSAGCPSCAGTEECVKDRCVGWSNWVSEESGASVDKNNPLSGMRCQGSYCDKVAVRYERAFNIYDDGSWSNWATDDGDVQVSTCPPGNAAIQVECTGRYCDEIRLKCAKFSQLKIATATKTEWFSEEDGGTMTCPEESVITGVECKERECFIGSNCKHYCDDKRLLCTTTSDDFEAGNSLAEVEPADADAADGADAAVAANINFSARVCVGLVPFFLAFVLACFGASA